MNIGTIDAPFGAEVTGMDLRQPLSDDTRTAINAAFVESGVLVFRDQHFSGPDQFLAAASNLGDPMPPVVATYRLPGYDAIEELTNSAVDKRTGENTPLYRGGSWHTDHSNLECPPKATTLYAIELPASGGGNTEFTNMMMAYDALDEPLKEKFARAAGVSGLSVASRPAEIAGTIRGREKRQRGRLAAHDPPPSRHRSGGALSQSHALRCR